MEDVHLGMPSVCPRTRSRDSGQDALPALTGLSSARSMPASAWSSEDDERLTALVAKYPRRWGIIAMNLQRVSKDCQQRWSDLQRGTMSMR